MEAGGRVRDRAQPPREWAGATSPESSGVVTSAGEEGEQGTSPLRRSFQEVAFGAAGCKEVLRAGVCSDPGVSQPEVGFPSLSLACWSRGVGVQEGDSLRKTGVLTPPLVLSRTLLSCVTSCKQFILGQSTEEKATPSFPFRPPITTVSSGRPHLQHFCHTLLSLLNQGT